MAEPPPQSPLVFPIDFPVKIMGKAEDGFAQSMLDVVLRHAPDFDVSSIELRASSGGNYTGLTCTIRATSREQIDALYRDLTGHPMVKVVL